MLSAAPLTAQVVREKVDTKAQTPPHLAEGIAVVPAGEPAQELDAQSPHPDLAPAGGTARPAVPAPASPGLPQTDKTLPGQTRFEPDAAIHTHGQAEQVLGKLTARPPDLAHAQSAPAEGHAEAVLSDAPSETFPAASPKPAAEHTAAPGTFREPATNDPKPVGTPFETRDPSAPGFPLREMDAGPSQGTLPVAARGTEGTTANAAVNSPSQTQTTPANVQQWSGLVPLDMGGKLVPAHIRLEWQRDEKVNPDGKRGAPDEQPQSRPLAVSVNMQSEALGRVELRLAWLPSELAGLLTIEKPDCLGAAQAGLQGLEARLQAVGFANPKMRAVTAAAAPPVP
jgi:hypothetical protein